MRCCLVLLAATLMACTPPASNSSPQRAGGPPSVAGTVRVVGSAPMNVQVVVEDSVGRSTTVAGPLVAEIQRLSGAQVELRGRMDRGVLTATSYEIRAVNGAPVEMGVVQRATDGSLLLRKADGRTVSLMGATSQFRVGQKVWVQGPAAVRVQSYGVITP